MSFSLLDSLKKLEKIAERLDEKSLEELKSDVKRLVEALERIAESLERLSHCVCTR